MRDQGIVVDRSSDVPLQRQLEASLRDAILSGRMNSGERILSSRELQTHLGLSRNTIVNAVAQLRAEGYLECIQGVGTFVAESLDTRRHPRLSGQQDDFTIVPSPYAARSLDARPLAENLSGAVPFRPGVPALDLFPASTFRRCLRFSASTTSAMDYPEAGGDRELREAIAQRLRQTRGVDCSPSQILITGGAQAAFALVAHVMLERGDIVLTEEPGYPSARATFLSVGAQITPVNVDRDGFDAAAIGEMPARMAHVSPSHQYPTGAVLSLERRFALLDWAEKHDGWILEDDYDSEFNYTGKPQPALFGLGEGRRVIYVGTFSKVLSPALRVGYLVVPRSLQSAFQAVHTVAGAQPSRILQKAVARFIGEGHFARHVTKMRKIYDERRKATAGEFVRAFGASAQIRDTKAGLHFIVRLAGDIPASSLSERAERAGYIIPALSSYCLRDSKMNGIVVGYAATSIDESKRAVHDLLSLARAI